MKTQRSVYSRFITTMLKNTHCLIIACDELRIPYSVIDQNKNFITIGEKNKFSFVNTATPFNRQDVASIASDKEFTYMLLRKAISMPRTEGYVNPFVEKKYKGYSKYSSYDEISEEIEKNFHFPVIIKPNSGSFGINVSLAESCGEVTQALGKIFNKHSLYYDNVALAQEKIDSKKEYRVVVVGGEVELIYETNFANVKFSKDKAKKVLEAKIVKGASLEFKKIQEFVGPLFGVLDLVWGGLDIILDKSDKLWLLEVNSKPHFDFFIKHNGEEKIVELYKKALQILPIS